MHIYNPIIIINLKNCIGKQQSMFSILIDKKIIHIYYNDLYEIVISWSTILIHK